MDYNDLAMFTRVVERGSFTAAARVAQLPKSSVTRSIARLERELGVRLIQRTTRQRGVTDAGRELFERVRAAVGVLEDAAEAVRERGHEAAGVVRVTANPDISMMGVPEALARLRTKYPRIHVELILTTRVVDLVAEAVDLGIRAGRLADSTLIAKRLGMTNAGLFATKAYLKRRGKPARVPELADYDCILFRAHRGRATWELEGPRGAQRIELAGVASADELRFIGEMIATDAGIGVLPLFMGVQLGLERVLPEHEIVGAPLHIVMPSGAFVPTRVTIVRDFLAEHLTRTLASCDEKRK
jgi:DNA-binding transcriptional LysR family regulator